jgi:hypothetical protein
MKASVFTTRDADPVVQEKMYAGYRDILEKVEAELERYPDAVKLELSSELKESTHIFDEQKKGRVTGSYPIDSLQMTGPTDFQDSFSRTYRLDPFENTWVSPNYSKKLIDQADHADNRLTWFQGIVNNLIQNELPRLAKLFRWEIKPLGKEC